ncbi:hypothetical protein WJX79_005075 [Trebouxia sp. C0005]
MGSEASFRDYDFTSDDRWNRYRAGIEIPPGRDEEAILHKYKLKWYQREVDPSYAPTGTSAATSSPSDPKPYSSGTAGSQDHHAPPAAATASNQSPPDDSSSGANAESSTARAAHATAGFRDKVSGYLKRSFSQTSQSIQTVLFCMHLTLVLLAVLHLQPLNRKLSQIAWVYFLQTSLLTHGYKVYLKGGFPRFSRSAFLATLQSWLQRVGGTTDFQYLMLSAMFLPQQSVSLVIVPITILAVYHAFAYCAKTFTSNALWQKYGVRAHSFLAAHQRDALMYNAAAEIGTGFLLTVMLATQRRAIVLTILHWNWLRMRYFSPDAAAYHSMVWGIIDQKVGPYIRQVSFLNTALRFGQRWFLSMGRP